MDYICNLDHAISFVGYYISDSNYGKIFLLNRESLDVITAPSVGEEQVTKF